MKNEILTVFLFQGQGGHYRGMGSALYESNSFFKQRLQTYDSIIADYIHHSIIEEIYHNKRVPFDDLIITNPAIVALQLALMDTLHNEKIFPSAVLGSSLGEFVAAVAANMWKPEDAIIASIEMARSIVSEVETGGMISIFNSSTVETRELSDRFQVYPAMTGFKNNITVSGSQEKLILLEEHLKKSGSLYQRLPVQYPFHSPLIATAAERFTYFCPAAFTQSHAVQFISGLNNVELKCISEDYLWAVISQYSDYSKSIEYIEKMGSCLYIDVGPSGSMATYAKYNLSPSSGSVTHQIMTPFKKEIEQLKKLRLLMNKHQPYTV